jgi:hypothetical protein
VEREQFLPGKPDWTDQPSIIGTWASWWWVRGARMAITGIGPTAGTGPAFLFAVLSNGQLFPAADAARGGPAPAPATDQALLLGIASKQDTATA